MESLEWEKMVELIPSASAVLPLRIIHLTSNVKASLPPITVEREHGLFVDRGFAVGWFVRFRFMSSGRFPYVFFRQIPCAFSFHVFRLAGTFSAHPALLTAPWLGGK
jgi:hypothetical protein